MIRLRRVDVCVARRGEVDVVDGHLFFELGDAYLLVTESGEAYISRDVAELVRVVRTAEYLKDAEKIELCNPPAG